MDLEYVRGGTDDLRVRLVSRAAYLGQFWIMTDVGNTAKVDVGLTGAYVNLTTINLHGAGYKLDVTNGGAWNNYGIMRPSAQITSQLWSLERTTVGVAA